MLHGARDDGTLHVIKEVGGFRLVGVISESLRVVSAVISDSRIEKRDWRESNYGGEIGWSRW